MIALHVTPVGKPNVWRADASCDCPEGCPSFWVVEYWVAKTICEKFFKTWADAIAFALAQATA